MAQARGAVARGPGRAKGPHGQRQGPPGAAPGTRRWCTFFLQKGNSLPPSSSFSRDQASRLLGTRRVIPLGCVPFRLPAQPLPSSSLLFFLHFVLFSILICTQNFIKTFFFALASFPPNNNTSNLIGPFQLRPCMDVVGFTSVRMCWGGI